MGKKKNPKIVTGASAYSREWDYKKFREIADPIGAFLMCDMAHPSGLIAKGLLHNPFHFVMWLLQQLTKHFADHAEELFYWVRIKRILLELYPQRGID